MFRFIFVVDCLIFVLLIQVLVFAHALFFLGLLLVLVVSVLTELLLAVKRSVVSAVQPELYRI